MAPATRRMSQSNRSWAIEYLRRNEFLDGDRGTGGRVFASAGCWIVPSLSNIRAFPSPPSSQLLQHCCKLVWIDTVGLHHCLDDRIGQDVFECWFVLTIIHIIPFLAGRERDWGVSKRRRGVRPEAHLKSVLNFFGDLLEILMAPARHPVNRQLTQGLRTMPWGS